MVEIDDNGGLKHLLILITVLCCIILAALFIVEVDQEQLDQIKPAGDTGFSFSKLFAYFKYYLSLLIGFLFGID